MAADGIQSLLKKILPFSDSKLPVTESTDTHYEERLRNEERAFENCVNVHELPMIFHYWSNKYLLPMFEQFGFNHPYDFFWIYARKRWEQHPDRPLRLVSIGSGNAEMEVDIARKLTELGATDFRFDCLEINRAMNERAAALAQQQGVQKYMNFVQADFNNWSAPAESYDLVVANQALHHVLELEHLFDAIFDALKEDGLFLTSDMIGRNGHMRWPEALQQMQPFWQELPENYRYNHLMARQEDQYINHDCSVSGFEGIRAQDILPLLQDRFGFELFVPFGNMVYVFTDRTFGHNFDDGADWDLNFIDRVHQADEQGFLDGSLKPTAMIAAMTKKPCQTVLRHEKLTPEYCIRDPNA